MGGDMPDGAQGNMPNGMPDGMSGNMPDGAHDNMSDNMPDNVPAGNFAMPQFGDNSSNPPLSEDSSVDDMEQAVTEISTDNEQSSEDNLILYGVTLLILLAAMSFAFFCKRK